MTTETKSPASTSATEVDPNLMQIDGKVFYKYLSISAQDTLARFTNDLRIMVEQAHRILHLAQRIQEAMTASEKDALTKARETELRDFNQKDAVFEKVYKFKADHVAIRPHFIQNTSIHLLTPVTDEQIDQVRKNPNFKESDIFARGNSKMVLLSTVTGGQIPVLERNVQIVQAQQNSLIQLRAAEQSTNDPEAKKKIQEEIEKVTESLKTNADFIGKTYGIFTNNIIFEPLMGDFWVALTKEELEKYLQSKQQASGSSPDKEKSKTETAKAKKD